MKPKTGLVIESMEDGGSLVIDEAAGKSHALKPEAAAVWSCLEDGLTDPEAIADSTSLDLEIVHRAVIQLAECDLIEDGEGASRRDLLSRAATIAGAAAGLKLVESVATPSPAAAQSGPDLNPM